jgi:hypothetical protein
MSGRADPQKPNCFNLHPKRSVVAYQNLSKSAIFSCTGPSGLFLSQLIK